MISYELQKPMFKLNEYDNYHNFKLMTYLGIQAELHVTLMDSSFGFDTINLECVY